MQPDVLFLGMKGSVAAIDQRSGRELWRKHLKGAGFVSVAVSQTCVFAQAYGHLFCLDRGNGKVLWENELPGLGYGLCCIALDGSSSDVAAAVRQIQAQQAAATSAASTTAVNT